MTLPRLALLSSLAALAACAAQPRPQAQQTVHISWHADGDACELLVDGRPIEMKALFAAARRWQKRLVEVIVDKQVPYRCVGGTLYTMQRAGVSRIGFIAEPPRGKVP